MQKSINIPSTFSAVHTSEGVLLTAEPFKRTAATLPTELFDFMLNIKALVVYKSVSGGASLYVRILTPAKILHLWQEHQDKADQ